MNNFKKTLIQNYTRASVVTSEECKYWKQLENPVYIKEFGSIDYISFSPVHPYNFAATCSLRVQIYNPLTKLVIKNISTFQKQAFGGSFRKDGKLLVAGNEDGNIRLFDTNTKTILRLFTGHTAPVHRTYFLPDLKHITSFSDDKTVKLWDLATERDIYTYREHTDYIRAGAVNPVSENTFISGGYDHFIKMYDTRSNKCIMSVDHGAPLESLLFLPSGGIFVSAGGNDIKFWDAISGGRQLGKISQHTKTVTCMDVTADGRHLVSGSLDRQIKFFNIANRQMIHNITFTNSILSVGVSKDQNTLVVGHLDGTLAILRREEKFEERALEMKREKRRKYRSNRIADEMVQKPQKSTEKNYDLSLRKFEYTKALDQVLKRFIVNAQPEVTVSIMSELIKRKGLHQAFSNRTQESIARILTFFNKYIGDGRFTRVLLDAISIFLDTYESQFMSLSPAVQRLIVELNRRISVEEELTMEFLKLEGAIDLLVNASEVNDDVVDLTEKIVPTERALEANIISV